MKADIWSLPLSKKVCYILSKQVFNSNTTTVLQTTLSSDDVTQQEVPQYRSVTIAQDEG